MILTSIGMIGDRQPGLHCIVQCFTSNATWLKCPETVCLEIVAIGAGAGGNSGGRCQFLSGTNRANVGGAGGGGGGAVVAILDGALIPASACVIVGVGGCGAVGRNTNGTGAQGGNGGNSCFGSCLIARGGLAINSNLGGGYANAIFGVNECAGIGGTGAIFTGTGTVYNGNIGGGMQANSDTSAGLKGGNGCGACVGGRGGAAGPSVATTATGTTSTGGSSSTLCGITLGAGGNSNSAGSAYGAGGGGGAACKTGTTPNAGAGSNGIVMVTQFLIS